MIAADVLVKSMSSFSNVASLYSAGVKLFFYHGGAVEAERMLKAREAQRAAKPPPPAPQSPDDDVQDDGWEIVKDVANPTGASPPVPPPEYCVVSVVASD